MPPPDVIERRCIDHNAGGGFGCSAQALALMRRITDGTYRFKVCTSNGQLLKICNGLQLGTNSVYNPIDHADHNSTEEFLLAAGENNETDALALAGAVYPTARVVNVRPRSGSALISLCLARRE